MNPHYRKEMMAEAQLAPVAEVSFSIGWQQLQRQTLSLESQFDWLAEPEESGAEAEPGFEPEVQCSVVSAEWSTPLNVLDKGTKKALGCLEDSLQALFGASFEGLPQLDATQACIAEANSLPTYCARTGTWRLSA